MEVTVGPRINRRHTTHLSVADIVPKGIIAAAWGCDVDWHSLQSSASLLIWCGRG